MLGGPSAGCCGHGQQITAGHRRALLGNQSSDWRVFWIRVFLLLTIMSIHAVIEAGADKAQRMCS
jgi:hypothetical protein